MTQHQDQVGDLEYSWYREYGSAYRAAGCYGVRLLTYYPLILTDSYDIQQDILAIADPKALQYITQGAGYRYPKSADFEFSLNFLFGLGILTAAGNFFVASCCLRSKTALRLCSPAAQESHEPGVLCRTASNLSKSFPTYDKTCKCICNLLSFSRLNKSRLVLAEAYGPDRRRTVDVEYEPMAWKADFGHYWRE